MGLDPNNFNNLHPISNLSFISKVIGKAVAAQLHALLSLNYFYEPFQSGFRSRHSTETALIKITNDLLLAADSGLLSILILLDLSLAFDTISHSILLDRLALIGITHIPFLWFQPYLSGHTHFILLNSCSQSSPVVFGVPQGSCPGALTFYYLHPTTWQYFPQI